MLSCILDLVFGGPGCLLHLPELNRLITERHRLVIELYGYETSKTKEHTQLHLVRQMQLHNLNVNTFKNERDHGAAKSLAPTSHHESYWHYALKRQLLSCLDHFQDGDTAKEMFLVKPKAAPELLRYLPNVSANDVIQSSNLFTCSRGTIKKGNIVSVLSGEEMFIAVVQSFMSHTPFLGSASSFYVFLERLAPSSGFQRYISVGNPACIIDCGSIVDALSCIESGAGGWYVFLRWQEKRMLGKPLP